MSRPRVFDCFPMAGTPTELLLLECRFSELYDAVDHFVVVESTVDHQDHDKPLHFPTNVERYARWADKIEYVVAPSARELSDKQQEYRQAFQAADTNNPDDLDPLGLDVMERRTALLAMPTLDEDSGPWAREHAQREWFAIGLAQLGCQADDIVLQSDLDEIPRPLHARNVRPQGNNFVGFHQRGHFWAIDWEYPPGWRGTVAGRRGAIGSFTQMRDTRNFAAPLQNAGWHFSWLGDREAWMRKVRSFCHPEVEDRIVTHADWYFQDGVHVDGVKMRPVDVDDTWPRWMQDPANVPAEWRRPR
jgi:beta-1,4-mannosyl-glycoprotein beta-1,4-N-acetylglucosaminyltransferase